MKGLAFLQIGKVGVIDKPIPEPGPNDAVIKTTASLICTSDVHVMRGVITIPERRLLGHESVGVVYKAGASVTSCKEGDRVAVCAVTPCGRCEYCQRGDTSQCGGMLGGLKFELQREGNLAEYFLVNDADYNLVPIPGSLTDEQAVYTTDMLTTLVWQARRTPRFLPAEQWQSSHTDQSGSARRSALGCSVPVW